MSAAPPLGWPGIIRVGLVQTALGSIVVLTTSTMNRVMVVELALPAMLPGALVALHYAVQVLRPRLGHGSDVGGRRTPWIIGGMGVLACGGIGAALATAWMASNPLAGTALAVVSFVLIGGGVGASGTSLLVLLAKRVHPQRRAAAASTVWLMMIAGFVVTALVAGHFLDPFTTTRLVLVTATVAAMAFVITLLSIRNIEGPGSPHAGMGGVPGDAVTPFRTAIAQVWAEPAARRFTIFVFVSMLAYSAQDLILEPFAGIVFRLTPGESTQLSGVQHGGVLVGMLLVAIAGSAARRAGGTSLVGWCITGCIGSALFLLGLCAGGAIGPAFPLTAWVFGLGLANGVFAVAAIGSMMGLVAAGRQRREGVRMGLWGAAQAIAFALGGFLGTAAVDLMRHLLTDPALAYGSVFAAEAMLFLAAAVLAARVCGPAPATPEPTPYAPAMATAGATAGGPH